MSIGQKSLNVYLCVLMIMSTVTFARDVSRADLKIALVGQIIKNTKWPGDQKSVIRIVIPADKILADNLSKLEGVRINGRRIDVIYVPNYEKLPTAELVYFSHNMEEVDNALALMRGKGVLVITENSPNLHNVMINIVEDTNQLTFQINRPNITFEKIKVNPELILFGGTELDVAQLYRETELSMQRLRQQNDNSLRQLATKREEIKKQAVALTAQKKEVANQKKEVRRLLGRTIVLSEDLSHKEEALITKQTELNDSSRKLDESRRELESSLDKLDSVRQAYLNEKKLFDDKLAKAKLDYDAQLFQFKSELNKNQQKVESQLRLLDDLGSQVEEKTHLLEKSKSDLAHTSVELKKEQKVSGQRAEVINRQYQIIAGIVLIVVIFAIAIGVISRLFLKNKRITAELKLSNESLEKTLATLERTQKQLVESEKLASLGQLVTGVAHEINTPIGVAITSSSSVGDGAKLHLKLLEEQKLRAHNIEDFLNTVIDAEELVLSNLERCAKLVQNFKQISADQVVAEDRSIRLKDYLQDILGALSITLKRSRVTWSVDGDNPEHLLDPGLLAQVINNLVTNSINYAFDGLDNRTINIVIRNGHDISEIEFTDNGSGMESDTLKKIFDPFFTTARGQGGTGLGMNIVHNLVTSKLHGKIEVQSQLGEGTTILIRLPQTA